MACKLTGEQIARVIDFHGHDCPGLWIGIRAAELCLERLGGNRNDNPILAVTETDMCGVDAIQVLTGCTFGKGNLIHRDYGKTAFSFYRREGDKAAFRAVFRPESRGDQNEMRELMRATSGGTATDAQKQRCKELREQSRLNIVDAELADLFDVEELVGKPPRPARILESLRCETCGEMVMESRTRRFDGKIFCIPCFCEVEQKV